MSNGEKRVIFNTSERAISDDINRLQRFASTDANEIWRAIFDTDFGSDDLNAATFDDQTFVATSPASAEIVGGFLVKPQIGAGVLSVLIDPGVLFIVDPDSPANPDETPYKMIRDPGVPVLGTLLMGANGGGSIRIDVVECARVAPPGETVLETDNRDIFDQTTGNFSSQTVNKVAAGQLQYRVRQGVVGGGFPGTATGWLPLAIVSVPAGSTTCDTMTFWDVRPLMSDRIIPGFRAGKSFPKLWPNYAQIDVTFGAVLMGTCDVSAADTVGGSIGYRRLGGNIKRGTPGTDGAPDMSNAANQCDPVAGNGRVFFYLIEPFGLPRWARYTDAAFGVRLPRSPRGIPVASMAVAPTTRGTPSAALSLPASTGLGGSTGMGVCIGASKVIAGVIQGMGSDGTSQMTAPDTAASVAAAADVASFSVVPNATTAAATLGYPGHARRLMVVATFQWTLAGTDDTMSPFLKVLDSGGNLVYSHTLGSDEMSNATGGGITYQRSYAFEIRVPVDGSLPDPAGFFVTLKGSAAVSTFVTGKLALVGWGL